MSRLRTVYSIILVLLSLCVSAQKGVYKNKAEEGLYTLANRIDWQIENAELHMIEDSITKAQTYVDRLYSSKLKTEYQDRLNSLFCVDCDFDSAYVDFYFDVLPDTFRVDKAILKFDKKVAYTFRFDDGYIEAYSNVFKYTIGQPDSYGNANDGVYYTDGCGNDIAFSCTTATPFDSSLYGSGTSYYNFEQMKEMFDYNWDVVFHGGTLPTGDVTTYQIAVDQIDTASAWAAKHFLGWRPCVMTNPNGDEIFYTADNNTTNPSGDRGYFAVMRGSNTSSCYTGGDLHYSPYYAYGIHSDTITQSTLNNYTVITSLLLNNNDETINDVIDTLAEFMTNGKHMYYGNFTHRVRENETVNMNFDLDSLKTLFDSIETLWGKKGTDEIWVTGASNYIEYQHTRVFSNISYEYKNDSTITVKINYPAKPDYFIRPSLTLNVFSDKDVDSINVRNAYNYSENIVDSDTGIVNVEWGRWEYEIAEDKVTEAEETRLPDYIATAQTFVDKIKVDVLQAPLQTRLDNIIPMEDRHIFLDIGYDKGSYYDEGGFWNSPEVGTSTNSKRYDSVYASDEKWYNYDVIFSGVYDFNSKITDNPLDEYVWPYKVFRDAVRSYTADTGTIQICNLESGKKYDLSFYASNSLVRYMFFEIDSDQGTSTINSYDIHNQYADTVYALNHTFANDTCTIRFWGETTSTPTGADAYGYLSGMKIREH